MLFRIVNPHDPYTMQADILEIAAVSVCIIGNGEYALEEISGDKSAIVPFFNVITPDEWFTKQFGRTLEQSVNWAQQHAAELCKCLSSVTIGDARNRRIVDELLAKSESYEVFISALYKLHDEMRKGDVDIGRTAWGMADVIHQQFGTTVETTQPH